MAIALTLQKYLDAKNVRYDLMRFPVTVSQKVFCYAMILAMHSLYCLRLTTLGSQRSRASLAKMLS